MEFQKNQIYKVTIEDIGIDGEGIGKLDGYPVFVKDAVPGDQAEVRLTKVKKNYAYARLEKLLYASPDRVTPPCPFHRQCGGCQIQALDYQKQLEFKQNKVENHLVRIGGFEPVLIKEVMEKVIGMEHPWHYRNKAQYPFGYAKDGELITGFYAGRTHSIIANTDCLLGAPENRKILEIILDHMKKYHVTAYHETTGHGLIRHVLIRKGFSSGELMVCFIINEADSGSHNDKHIHDRKIWIPEQDKLVDRLALLPGMTSISVNLNSKNTNVIMGSETYTVWGRERIRDTMHLLHVEEDAFVKTGKSITFSISPRSFYQVNPVQAEKLYSVVLSYAGLMGKETVWDLYCGIGTISLFLAQAAWKVYGVEVVPEAIKDARENARQNGIENVQFFAGKAEEVLPEFYREYVGKENGNRELDRQHGIQHDMKHPDVIVVDPPRKGCDNACLQTILKMRPERVIYVSCDSATLARDLKILCEREYELKKARVCDQFCQGVHVETIALLQKSNWKCVGNESKSKLASDLGE